VPARAAARRIACPWTADHPGRGRGPGHGGPSSPTASAMGDRPTPRLADPARRCLIGRRAPGSGSLTPPSATTGLWSSTSWTGIPYSSTRSGRTEGSGMRRYTRPHTRSPRSPNRSGCARRSRHIWPGTRACPAPTPTPTCLTWCTRPTCGSARRPASGRGAVRAVAARGPPATALHGVPAAERSDRLPHLRHRRHPRPLAGRLRPPPHRPTRVTHPGPVPARDRDPWRRSAVAPVGPRRPPRTLPGSTTSLTIERA
jgi:hypothetical protein